MSESEKTEIEMPFLDHLEALRWHIIKALISIVILTIICFYFAEDILDLFLLSSQNLSQPINLQVLKVQTTFIIYLEIALIFGIVLSLPVIFYQIWSFVAPGLLEKERKYVVPVILFATISFIFGATFAYLIIVPYALEFFLALAPGGVTNAIALDYYFGFVLRIVIVFGIVFELPVATLFLTKIGLLTPKFLRKYRRYAIIIIFVLAAILTPPDPTTQIMLGIPLIALYEISIWISYVFNKKKKNQILD
jgi:sec-independent protein translocase protein TatC